jgi:hypothetical protein
LLPNHPTGVNRVAFLKRTPHGLIRNAADRGSFDQVVDHQAIQPTQFLLIAFILRQYPTGRHMRISSDIVRFAEQVCKHRVAEVQARPQFDFRRNDGRIVGVVLYRPLPSPAARVFPEVDAGAEPIVAVLARFPFIKAYAICDEFKTESPTTAVIAYNGSGQGVKVPEECTALTASQPYSQNSSRGPGQESGEREPKVPCQDSSAVTLWTFRFLRRTNKGHTLRG